MIVNRIQTLHPLIKWFASILGIIVLGGALLLAFLLYSPSRVFAASLQRIMGTTCVHAPSIANCNQQDPEVQGCAADARTIGQVDITKNGIVIGRVERRYSLKCNAWWGRVFDDRAGSQGKLSITMGGKTTLAVPTFVGKQYRILYSPMVFDATKFTAAPAITGSLQAGSSTASVSATLPTISVPIHVTVKS